MALFKCPPPAERTNSFLWMIHLDIFYFFCSSFHNVMQPDSSYITSLQLHQRTGTTFLHNQISDLTNNSFSSWKKGLQMFGVQMLMSGWWLRPSSHTVPEPTGGFRGGGSFSLVFRPAEISTKMILTPDSKEKNAVRFIFNLFNKEPSHCDTMQTREREKQSLSIEGSMQFPSAGINNSDSGSENNTKIIHHHVFVYYSYDFMFSDD